MDPTRLINTRSTCNVFSCVTIVIIQGRLYGEGSVAAAVLGGSVDGGAQIPRPSSAHEMKSKSDHYLLLIKCIKYVYLV